MNIQIYYITFICLLNSLHLLTSNKYPGRSSRAYSATCHLKLKKHLLVKPYPMPYKSLNSKACYPLTKNTRLTMSPEPLSHKTACYSRATKNSRRRDTRLCRCSRFAGKLLNAPGNLASLLPRSGQLRRATHHAP